MKITAFQSEQALAQAFEEGLVRLLQQPGLGSYILVHANAAIDAGLHEALRPALQSRFTQLADACRENLSEGRELGGGEDDQLVFLKLMALGFEAIETARFRSAGAWELQFNPLRAFRPSRMSREPVSGIQRPFDPQGFHFNKPFLRKEVFWAGELQGVAVELLYNKFPFVPLHSLLVPERTDHHPQYLTARYHDYVWRLCESLGTNLPRLHVAYNSYGAYASVNHLHFQMFMGTRELPLTRDCWRHNGGARGYPVECEVFDAPDPAWRMIEALHARGIGYNLIYRPGRLYCIPRRTQGTYEQAAWTQGFAWYEVSGGVTTFSRSDFDTLDERAIEEELGKLNLAFADASEIEPSD
ncbi:MAG: hypothetical protein ABW076_10205 [Candidatus Thiodiazotropha sp.]